MLSYAPCEIADKVEGVIPKIGDQVENSLFNKLITRKKTLGSLTSNNGDNLFYYHGTPRYWIKGMDYAPKYYSENEGEGISSEYKCVNFDNYDNLSV